MKKYIAGILAFVFICAAISGTALAASVPSAMTYFTSTEYNKTFDDDLGNSHTLKATKVTEVWNKAGNVLHIIETKETYTDGDGNEHIIVRDDSKIYNNACPKYPDSSQQTVYRVEWFPDGHSTVIYDHRPASTPIPTATPKPTVKPTAKPTARPTVKPTLKPTVAPTVKPTVAPTTIQQTSPTASPGATPELTALPTATPVVSPSPSPSVMASIQSIATPSSTVVLASASVTSLSPTPATVSVQAGQKKDTRFLTWGLVAFCITCLVIIVLRKKRRKEPRS